MKNKKLTNPLNAILTLVFTLGALALAIYKGVSVVFPLLGLIAILFEQWSLNLVPDNDISSQKDEKEKDVYKRQPWKPMRIWFMPSLVLRVKQTSLGLWPPVRVHIFSLKASALSKKGCLPGPPFSPFAAALCQSL